ncbi:MAG TPA: hypothetical protein PK168_01200 [Candidatus Paceibacterota bacterium]|nr:hypothetical protein [Parcubacteria group bacterium]HOM33195.1 hypothetical protein [Candidatus Paceibacterota bacterium]HPC37254.1 hypothetical protein [Candidatus Paceibacterota bacterium]HRU35711.1 hypothetical protein [Candidatus Paceibacterota bacterium]
MFAIISQLFFFLGLVTIIFLVARKTPQSIEGLDLDKNQTLDVQIENHMGKTFLKIPWDKIDESFEKFLEKIIRRLHILTMKNEIFLQKYLNSLKEKEKEHSSFVEEIKNQQILIDQNTNDNQLITEDIDSIKDDLNLEELSIEEDLISKQNESDKEIKPVNVLIESKNNENKKNTQKRKNSSSKKSLKIKN